MIIRKAVYKEKTVKQKYRVTDAVYGCDECKTAIKEYPNEDNRLEVVVFKHTPDGTSSEDLHFCSWQCVVNHLPKIETNYFVSLPHLSFEGAPEERTAKSLFAILAKLK